MMVPVGRLILLQTIAKSELIAAMNWLLVPATIGPLMGPPLGGFLVTAFDWRLIFVINVPIGAVGLVFAWRLIPQLRAPAPGVFDAAGMAYSGVALAALIFGLELASRGALPPAASLSIAAAGVAAALLYVRHARLVERPILDFGLMRIPTFANSVIAGAATRIAIGAMPFLLPLTLQVGLGMSAARSGLTTFAGAIGSLAMRGLSRRIIRRYGYRRVLMVNGVGASLFAFACATFRPGTPAVLIYAVLLLGGFSQSLQFVAYNTIAYADVPPERMSAATSFYSTLQQVMLTIGICVAATALAIAAAIRGDAHPGAAELSVGFMTVGAVALLAPILSSRLVPEAGHELSGHRAEG